MPRLATPEPPYPPKALPNKPRPTALSSDLRPLPLPLPLPVPRGRCTSRDTRYSTTLQGKRPAGCPANTPSFRPLRQPCARRCLATMWWPQAGPGSWRVLPVRVVPARVVVQGCLTTNIATSWGGCNHSWRRSLGRFVQASFVATLRGSWRCTVPSGVGK